MKLLLSIKPVYATKILLGEKKFEYRKHLPKEEIDTIIIYATAPIKKVLGEVKVMGIISMRPSPLWEKTKSNAGISREGFRKYFKGCSKAFAYQLGEVVKYNPEKDLKDYGFDQPPQSFRYIKNED